MGHLVEAALQERAVDGHHRPHALGREARGKGDGVLLGDAHIEAAVREGLLEEVQARAVQHGGGDADNLLVGAGQLHQGLAEHAGVAGRGGLRWVHHDLGDLAGLGVEGRDAVPLHRVLHGGLVAVALLGLHVQQHRAVLHLLLGLGQGLGGGVHIMAVHGAQVAEAQVLEEQARHHEALEALLAPLRGLGHALAQAPDGDGLDGVLDALAPAVVVLAGHDLVQVALQRAHVGVDAHVVVVEDHQEVLGDQVAGLVEGLEGHAGGHGAVADYGDADVVLLLQVAGLGHAEGGGDAGAGVPRAEVVVGALIALEEAGQAVVHAQGGEAVPAACQDLVRVGLVAHVPDDAVLQEVEVVEEGDRQLDGAEVRAEVAAGLGHRGDEEGAHFRRQLLHLGRGEVFHLLGGRQRVEQGIGAGGSLHAGP